jgi:hypothetical protein
MLVEQHNSNYETCTKYTKLTETSILNTQVRFATRLEVQSVQLKLSVCLSVCHSDSAVNGET